MNGGAQEMDAVVIRTPGKPAVMHVEKASMPEAPPDHVVIAVEAAGVNPVDAGFRTVPIWAGIQSP
jgi:NADPH:quinone reductase-like Zn-dependent oxidoreductase